MPRRTLLSADFENSDFVKEVSDEHVSLMVKVGKGHTGANPLADRLLQRMEAIDHIAAFVSDSLN